VDAFGFQCKNNEYFKMNTKSVYNAAIKALPNVINEVLKKSMLTIDDIDYLVPHQPSIKILTEVVKIIGLPIEKLLMNMEDYGNTVSATIPILLHNNINKFKKYNKIMFASVGSGWTYGAMIYEF
jgi:3-oxoacyl-[acyl-carrier-protein] synthase-3